MKKMFVVSAAGKGRIGYFSNKETAEDYAENVCKYLGLEATVLPFQHTVPMKTTDGGYL